MRIRRGVLVVVSTMLISLALTSPASAATCFAGSCTGLSPETTGCAADAFTPRSHRAEGRLIELRYSPTCRAAWARISNGIRSDLFYVRNSNKQQTTAQIPNGATSAFTTMLSDKDLVAWACFVRGAYTACTGSY